MAPVQLADGTDGPFEDGGRGPWAPPSGQTDVQLRTQGADVSSHGAEE